MNVVTQYKPLVCNESCQGLYCEDYQGCVNTSKHGHVCKRWALQDTYNPVKYGIAMPNNYCRNPGASGSTIWCYTVDEVVVWDYCVPRLVNETAPITKEIQRLLIPLMRPDFGTGWIWTLVFFEALLIWIASLIFGCKKFDPYRQPFVPAAIAQNRVCTCACGVVCLTVAFVMTLASAVPRGEIIVESWPSWLNERVDPKVTTLPYVVHNHVSSGVALPVEASVDLFDCGFDPTEDINEAQSWHMYVANVSVDVNVPPHETSAFNVSLYPIATSVSNIVMLLPQQHCLIYSGNELSYAAVTIVVRRGWVRLGFLGSFSLEARLKFLIPLAVKSYICDLCGPLSSCRTIFMCYQPAVSKAMSAVVGVQLVLDGLQRYEKEIGHNLVKETSVKGSLRSAIVTSLVVIAQAWIALGALMCFALGKRIEVPEHLRSEVRNIKNVAHEQVAGIQLRARPNELRLPCAQAIRQGQDSAELISFRSPSYSSPSSPRAASTAQSNPRSSQSPAHWGRCVMGDSSLQVPQTSASARGKRTSQTNPAVSAPGRRSRGSNSTNDLVKSFHEEIKMLARAGSPSGSSSSHALRRVGTGQDLQMPAGMTTVGGSAGASSSHGFHRAGTTPSIAPERVDEHCQLPPTSGWDRSMSRPFDASNQGHHACTFNAARSQCFDAGPSGAHARTFNSARSQVVDGRAFGGPHPTSEHPAIGFPDGGIVYPSSRYY